MRKEFYKTLLNPATKHVAIKSIKNELTYVTSSSNIINILTDNKMRNSTQYIRTTVFVQEKDEIRYKNLYRVEERLKKLFGIKFKVIFCNANLSPNEILRLSSLKGKNTISFIDIENFTLREQSEKEKIQNIRNLVFETLIMGSNDSMVICANGEVLDLSKSYVALKARVTGSNNEANHANAIMNVNIPIDQGGSDFDSYQHSVSIIKNARMTSQMAGRLEELRDVNVIRNFESNVYKHQTVYLF